MPHDMLNNGNGILVMEKITPVIEALFDSFHLQKVKGKKNQFYISRRSKDREIHWSIIKDHISRIIHQFGLNQPDIHCIHTTDYFEYLLPQMEDSNAFTDDQVLHLADLLMTLDEESRIEFEQLFKLALVFNDGHDLKSLHYQSAWHCHRPNLFHFGGDAVYATKDIQICADTNLIMEFAEKLSNRLEKGDINESSKCVCEYLAQILVGLFDHKMREKLIEQIALDFPKVAPMVYKTLEDSEDDH